MLITAEDEDLLFPPGFDFPEEPDEGLSELSLLCVPECSFGACEDFFFEEVSADDAVVSCVSAEAAELSVTASVVSAELSVTASFADEEVCTVSSSASVTVTFSLVTAGFSFVSAVSVSVGFVVSAELLSFPGRFDDFSGFFSSLSAVSALSSSSSGFSVVCSVSNIAVFIAPASVALTVGITNVSSIT